MFKRYGIFRRRRFRAVHADFIFITARIFYRRPARHVAVERYRRRSKLRCHNIFARQINIEIVRRLFRVRTVLYRRRYLNEYVIARRRRPYPIPVTDFAQSLHRRDVHKLVRNLFVAFVRKQCA